MPKPLTLGEVARRSRDGEGKDADKKQKTQRYKPCLSETSYRCAFVFYFAGLALSGADAPAPLKRGAIGKEVSFSMKLICVCWKTSRNAKASPTRGGGIKRSEDVGEVVQSSTCVIPLPLKASFVQPLSLASARQLPWQGSPWQRDFVSQ